MTEQLIIDDPKFTAIDRTYQYTSSGEEVRVLWVDRYDQDGKETATYVYRLRGDDPRPKGRLCEHFTGFDDFLATLPFGCWINLVWDSKGYFDVIMGSNGCEAKGKPEDADTSPGLGKEA